MTNQKRGLRDYYVEWHFKGPNRSQIGAEIIRAIADLKRWKLVQNQNYHVIKAIRETPLMRFVDDITLEIEETEDHCITVKAFSKSRVGMFQFVNE